MRREPYKIKSIIESLRDDMESGKITLHEAAQQLQEAGWTNFVDEETARKLLRHTKQCEDEIENLQGVLSDENYNRHKNIKDTM